MLDGSVSILDSLFKCLTMYFLNYSDTPINILVEIARWLAPLTTASSIIFTISYLKEKINNHFIYKSGKSIAVYGTDTERQTIFSQLGKYAIKGTNDFIYAQRYILAYSESENFKFYNQYKELLDGHKIYLKCSNIPSQLVTNPNISLYSIEEIFARLYWKKNCIYSLSKKNNHKLNIAIVGFGKLGEEILYYGLLNNIFSPTQQITYHIFGNCQHFLNLHRELDSISDKIIIHNEPWYERTDTIQKANLLLLVEQEEQMERIHEFNMLIPQKEFTVFISNNVFSELYSNYKTIRGIDWKTEANRVKYIMGDEFFHLAKSINLMYANHYFGTAMNDENLDTEWSKLDTFTRYSNISSADYHEIRLKMMAIMGISTNFEEINGKSLELLAALEHIRWCRYHFLNNWKYGIPKNNKNKDSNLRIHKDLVDYNQLSEADRKKDIDNIKLLLDISF